MTSGKRARRRVTVKARGRQSERSFPLSTPARTIEDWKDRERARLKERQPRAARGSLTKDVDTYLDTLVDRPKLRAERTFYLAWWIQRFGTLKREDIVAVMIRTALAERRTEYSASYCNHYRTALLAVWTTLDGKAKPNPFKDVPKQKQPEAEARALPWLIVERILDTMVDRGRPVKGKARAKVSLSKLRSYVEWQTGMSPAEIMRVQAQDLYLPTAALYARPREKGQGVEGVMMPLTPAGVDAWSALQAAGGLGRYSTAAVYKSFRLACDKLLEADAQRPEHEQHYTELGRLIIERARPYDLRHTFGTFVFRMTGDLHATQEMMRHADQKTTKRYTRAAVPAHLRAATDRLSAGTLQPSRPQKIAG